MKKYLLIFLLFGCKKESTINPTPTPPSTTCKTCVTTAWQQKNQNATITIPPMTKAYCNNEWVGMDKQLDTLIIEYNYYTKKNDTTHLVSKTSCN